jgi:hypothetical protein
MIGSNREAVTRAMKELREKGAVGWSGVAYT